MKSEEDRFQNAAAYRPFARIAVRGVAEYCLHFCTALTRHFDGDIDIGLLFVTLLRRADLDGTGIGTMAPTSISALSRSTKRPFETMRRLCNRLVAMGLVERCEAGPFVPDHVVTQPTVVALRAACHDYMIKMIEDFVTLDYPLPVVRGTGVSRATVERAAIDTLMHAFEFGVPPHPTLNWQRPFLYVSLMTGNARRYTFDHGLAHRYADIYSPPPDALRTPIGASVLARAVAIPYSTVRNNLEAMVVDGILERTPKGYLISMAWMQRPELAAAGAAVAAQLDRALRGLAYGGFPMDAPATAYWRGRPPLIAFD